MTATYNDHEMERDLALSAQAETVSFHFQPTRRDFAKLLGAGILVAAAAPAFGQVEETGPQRGNGRRGGGGGIGGAPIANLAARIHIAKDGTITVLCGKVECGQGARAEVTQAAAEELHVAPAQINCILSDTELCPNDGPTVGSGTTPRTIPPIRQAAAAARDLLVSLACKQLNLQTSEVTVSNGLIFKSNSNRSHAISFAELAGAQNLDELLAAAAVPRDVTVSAVKDWSVLGTPVLRPNARDIVTGKHVYPSDMLRPGMLYAKLVRPPAYNSKLTSIDTAAAQAMKGVIVVRDGDFVAVGAPTTAQAENAVDALSDAAKWEQSPHPSSKELAAYLVKNARIPANQFTAELGAAAKVLRQDYFIPYVQHAPMEPRAAVAEWSADGRSVTVWTGTQNPFAVRGEVATALRVAPENVRIIVNDFGGGFGGKHTGECAVAAARIAKAAGKPIHLRWTREEEFTWAYFRPAGVMQAQASLDAGGRITSWHFININSGPSAVQTPYNIARNFCQTVNSQPPLRHGSYRGLAATANAFARECFMDELAEAAGQDPLAFRVAHLRGADPRLAAVLQSVAQRFDWPARAARKEPHVGVGIACAVEKGGYVATAAQVVVDPVAKTFKIQHIAHVYECGKILNPAYLLSQVQGAVIQGLGPILREAMIFEKGQMQNASFADYEVPRFADVPPLDVFLLDRPDLPSAGAGETPLISLAPAVANAVARATGQRLRELPLKIV